MGKKIKILQDDEIIFEEEFERVELSQSRKVQKIYRLGETKPFAVVPSMINYVTLKGLLTSKPNTEFVSYEE